MQFDIQPGIFDPVSNQDIGTFALNQWQYIKLDDFYKFLMSGIVLKVGPTIIPQSAYELAQDDDATAQEVGLTGATLIGMIRITNISYAGVTLNITGNNYGTYVSNESTTLFVADQIATRIVPSGLDIQDGEPAIFNSASGLAVKTGNSSGISLYLPGTTYSVAGTLVRIEGSTYAATGVAGNLNKDPRLQENALFWFTPPDDKTLEYLAKQGDPINGGMHTISDRASANYQQFMKIASKDYNSITYDFYLMHLDGTVVTGDSVLENIFNVGAGNEYAYLDYYAPDVLSTRTLLDIGGHVTESMTSSGVVDTLGELHDDYMQRITGEIIAIRTFLEGDGVFSDGTSGTAGSSGTANNKGLLFDSADSTSPNAAKTNDDRTAHAALVTGCAYIIVMVAA